MKCKKACLIVNPRNGENLGKLPDVLAVFKAAGWSTDVALKEFAGHGLKLAKKAAEMEYDLVIAQGGDGTLNEVVNGVMNAQEQHSIVGLIPGGTDNQWGGELGIPADPENAALTHFDSYVDKVDIGHDEVETLTFVDSVEETGRQGKGAK